MTTSTLDWPAIARQAMHPTQVSVLELMQDGQIRSAQDISQIIGRPLGCVAYHCKVLREEPYELLHIVEVIPIRGAFKYMLQYRAPDGEGES